MASPYLNYFGLQREPFTIAPDPSLLYPSHCHREAVAHLRYGLECEGGFILLTGEVGTGKTTLTRMLLSTLPSEVQVAYLLHSQYAADDLLASLLQELAIDLPEPGPVSFSKQCIDRLYQSLLTAHSEGKKTLVVIEEAQNLSTQLLEMLRLLSNLETDRSKLLHILLVGQPELLDQLALPELRQLNQRVVSRFHLKPLASSDIDAYLDHRLRAVGAQRKLFTAASAASVAKLSAGIPRRVNLLAQQALIAAYAQGDDQVTSKLVNASAVQALGDSEKSAGGRKRLLSVVLLLVMVLGLVVSRQHWQPWLDYQLEGITAAPSSSQSVAHIPGFKQPLRAGDKNTALVNWLVAELQRQQLLELGYISGGRYNPTLVEAVTRWQQRQGLPASGVVDSATLQSLQQAGPRPE